MTSMLRIIGSQFRRPSGMLGRIISLLMLNGNKPAYDKLIPELQIKQNDRILEIGYGHGMGVKRIASGWDCYVTRISIEHVVDNLTQAGFSDIKCKFNKGYLIKCVKPAKRIITK